MTPDEMKSRTKQFAVWVLKTIDQLPNTRAARVVADQLGRSGASVGANYRAACRGRSRREFIAKIGIVEEESDESAYWLELIMESAMLPARQVKSLHQEAVEICRMMVATIRTARANEVRSSANPQSAIRNPRSR
ncbi:MAG: four helix bundle protein [Phycisphaerae bacterium]|nr:four helix bundle protein [Tepidisphaeraceae bacterium]